MNGTFYAIGKSEIYGIAIQDNKALEINSFVSNFKKIKRGTVWFDGQKMHIDRIYNAKTEIKTNIKWAISGIMLYPNYDPELEGFTGAYSDVLRKANHTAIGFKENKIYLIAGKNLSLHEFRKNILNSKIAFDGLINLDGGGSTQMNYNNKSIISTSRVLNHAISVKC
ncbi:MAG: phosphodiester glycosidase family protein [Peptoniphilus sp.]|uniref:phosphodiester glycosidase family protein n=1 Tax=Peptoniphilus sp. TaxID=1971214 RepID=UPI002A762EEF|nr:phosphodiester glycosidase family protein [Peptoniphilus sp.]MDY2987720.1 phosphodiester glycosidase family protein [Peptoniphilus sp.]